MYAVAPYELCKCSISALVCDCHARCRPVPGTVHNGSYGSGKGFKSWALPADQVVRKQRFIQAHPEWSIHAQDRGTRFIAEKGDGRGAHIVAALSLQELLNRLEEITAGR